MDTAANIGAGSESIVSFSDNSEDSIKELSMSVDILSSESSGTPASSIAIISGLKSIGESGASPKEFSLMS